MDVLNCIITIQILYNLDLHDMFKYSLGKVSGIFCIVTFLQVFASFGIFV